MVDPSQKMIAAFQGKTVDRVRAGAAAIATVADVVLPEAVVAGG